MSLMNDYEIWLQQYKVANPGYIEEASLDVTLVMQYASEANLTDTQTRQLILSESSYPTKGASQGFVLGYVTPPSLPLELSYSDRAMLGPDRILTDRGDPTRDPKNRFTSGMLTEYIDNLSETDYENLAQGLFVDGYMAGVIDDSSEYLDRINVIAAAAAAAKDVERTASSLGVGVQDLLAEDDDNKMRLAPTLEGRYADTDFDSDEFERAFYKKMNETKEKAIVLPDAQSVQLAYDEASQKILGYDLRKTNPQIYQAFLAGMRSVATSNDANDSQYDTSARIQTNIMGADPVGAEFLKTSGRRDNFMDAIFGGLT